MAKVSYRVNGREVGPRQFADAFTASALEHITSQVKARLESERCPEHGERATVTVKSTEGQKLSFEITGCCSHLVEQAKATLS